MKQARENIIHGIFIGRREHSSALHSFYTRCSIRHAWSSLSSNRGGTMDKPRLWQVHKQRKSPAFLVHPDRAAGTLWKSHHCLLLLLLSDSIRGAISPHTTAIWQTHGAIWEGFTGYWELSATSTAKWRSNKRCNTCVFSLAFSLRLQVSAGKEKVAVPALASSRRRKHFVEWA